MCRKGLAVLSILWAAGILAVILLVRQWAAVLLAAVVSVIAAVLYLAFADAYDFYSAGAAKKAVRHTGRAGGVFTYLIRYLMANKTYLVNTVGLCGIACFLPLLFGEFHGLNLFPMGLSILCLNTPICTLLSGDPDLEQAIRILPGQTGRFYRGYCLFIFTANSIAAVIYLCSWQIVSGGINFIYVGTLLIFALQSAILSVILEWKYPIRGLENRKRSVASSPQISCSADHAAGCSICRHMDTGPLDMCRCFADRVLCFRVHDLSIAIKKIRRQSSLSPDMHT